VPAFKRWIVEQAQLPGMSLAGLAMSNQLNANQLRRWVHLHGNHGDHGADPRPAVTLLPVTVQAHAPPTRATPRPPATAVEIEVAGVVVRVHDGVAPATLRTVLACLRASAP
jgi:transposase